MDSAEFDVVTGAFSHTGKYITRRLLSLGRRVRTLTGRPDSENPFGNKVKAFPFNFNRPGELTQSLRGATTLYNTYWIRFSHQRVTFDKAVANSKTLIKAAKEAGVRRIVHISISSPSEESPLPYFRGKALVERAVIDSGLSYDIIRPTLIFGPESILINNIAWLLRKFPIFAIPGSGDYRVQPVFVEDVAEIAVGAAQRSDDIVMDAVGPEVFTFDELVRLIARKVCAQCKIVHIRPRLALILARLIGYAVRDVVLTRDEIKGLMSNLLVSKQPPTASTHFTAWLDWNAGKVGIRYFSELARHYR